MGTRCYNVIQLVSSEAGISHVLEHIREFMGLPLSIDKKRLYQDEERVELLARSVSSALKKHCSGLDALFEKDGTRLLESCVCIVYPYRKDVWVLAMHLRTDGSPVEHAFESMYSDNADYLFSNVWNLEGDFNPQEIVRLWHSGEARFFVYSNKDEDFGVDKQAAAYVREALGLAPSLFEWQIRELARADNVSELEKHSDEKAVREYATHADFNKLFKDGRYELYAFLLRISSIRTLRYAPRDIEKYLLAFCEDESHAAMDAFLKRYAWNDADLGKAVDIVSRFCSTHPENTVATCALSRLEAMIKQRAEERSDELAEAPAAGADGFLRIDYAAFRLNGGIPAGFYRGDPSIKRVLCEHGVIREHAFAECENLESFEIDCHSGLVEIGDGCFAGCPKLTSFKTSGYKISALGAKVFDGCASIKSLALQLDKATIKADALGELSHLGKVSVSGSGRISKNALRGCSALKSLRIGKNVTLNQGALSELSEDVAVRR